MVLKSLNIKLPSKEKFYFHSFLTGRKNNVKENEHVLKVWDRSEMKRIKYYQSLYFKCDVYCYLVCLKNSGIVA